MFAALARKTPANAYVFLIVTMLLWAGNHVVGKWANGNIPPMTLAFLRWLGAAIVILPFAWHDLSRDKNVIANHWPILLVLGTLGSGVYNTLQYLALTHTSVTSASILNSWAPVLIATAGALMFGDQLKKRQIAGLALSLTGVMIIVLRGDIGALTHFEFNRGDLIMLMATGIWAAYTTLLRLRPSIATLSFAALTYSIAAVINLPLAGWEYAHGQYIVWSWYTIAAIAYTALLASLLAYYLYARSVEIVGATRTGAFIHFIPLFASVMAMAFLGEAPALYHLIGFIAILSGVALVSAFS